jgi:hypothetical protein
LQLARLARPRCKGVLLLSYVMTHLRQKKATKHEPLKIKKFWTYVNFHHRPKPNKFTNPLSDNTEWEEGFGGKWKGFPLMTNHGTVNVNAVDIIDLAGDQRSAIREDVFCRGNTGFSLSPSPPSSSTCATRWLCGLYFPPLGWGRSCS